MGCLPALNPQTERTLSGTSTPPEAAAEKPRIRARVALCLLQAIRDHDLPPEVLEDENVSVTLPRRFGLSGVVESQIHQLSQAARRGSRGPDSQVYDLIRLVIRRPDAEDLFHWVGRELSRQEKSRPALRWVVLQRLTLRLARRRAERGLANLFGRPVVGKADGGKVVLEAQDPFLVEADPGGDACHIVTGYLEEVLGRSLRRAVEVRHLQCRGRRDPLCRWDGGPVGEAFQDLDAVPGPSVDGTPS